MRMKKGAMFAVMAAGLVACGGAQGNGPAPIATISVSSNAVAQSAPAAAEAAQPAGTVTFIEFYAEW
jgi:ABC-type glycerol-3-phosphate transport system substrate-binding protein